AAGLLLAEELPHLRHHLVTGAVAGDGDVRNALLAGVHTSRRPHRLEVGGLPGRPLDLRARNEAELPRGAGRVTPHTPSSAEPVEPGVDRSQPVERDRGDVVRREAAEPPGQARELTLL